MTDDAARNARGTGLGFLQRRVDRRKVLGGAAGVAAGLASAGQLRAAPMIGRSRRPSGLRQETPADAAPPERQVIYWPADAANVKALDFYESVYERGGAGDLFSEPLVRLDRNFTIQPAGAESWSSSEDGRIWTFKIRQGIVWSDGNPVTAEDYVATLRYAADPEHAWDFTWYFQGIIAGWNDAIEGKIPLDQMGVRTGANEYELVIETENPAPYLPAMLLYSCPLSKAALETHGPLYNTNPETAVSSGPFILAEWIPDQQIVLRRNESYNGTMNVPVNEVIYKLTSPDNYFTLYQSNELDYVENPGPAAIELMMADPELAGEVYSGVADFPTYYIFFDVTQPPFDNKLVRQAWSHAIDREAIKESILGPSGTPAYSWLAPGFPASNREGLKDIQRFDPELARQLLAEAGYPNGEGFPKLEMWIRDRTPLDQAVPAACAAMLKEHLNIDVELVQKPAQEFMSALTAKPTQVQLGWVRYGMDFFDPYNMLSVWVSGGRHSWSNPEYDAKVKEAAEYLGPPEERIRMFQEAERILVEDVPAVFVFHGTYPQVIKPWLLGAFKEPDENGISALHWPGYTTMSTVPQELYVGKEAPR